MKIANRRCSARSRRGMSAVEVIMSLLVTLGITVTAYAIAVRSCGALHHVISTMVASPY